MLGYCLKCKKKTSIKDRVVYKTKKNKYMAKGICNECGTKISTTIKKEVYNQENVLSNRV